jgi:hypothetical protein
MTLALQERRFRSIEQLVVPSDALVVANDALAVAKDSFCNHR